MVNYFHNELLSHSNIYLFLNMNTKLSIKVGLITCSKGFTFSYGPYVIVESLLVVGFN